MILKCHDICVFIFNFYLETTLRENKCMRTTPVAVMVNFVILKVLNHSYVQISFSKLRRTLTTAFERHLTIGNFTHMDQYRCRVCTKTFDRDLSNKPSFKI